MLSFFKRQKKYTLPKARIQLVMEDTASYSPRIHTADDVYNIIRDEAEPLDREHFYSLLLDVKNKIIAVDTVSVGALNKAIVHPREVFKAAILANAGALIFAHNHPSGDPNPSQEDISLTDRLLAAGELLGIPVIDHVIIGRGRFCSLREEGYFNPHKYSKEDKISLALYGQLAAEA